MTTKFRELTREERDRCRCNGHTHRPTSGTQFNSCAMCACDLGMLMPPRASTRPAADATCKGCGSSAYDVPSDYMVYDTTWAAAGFASTDFACIVCLELVLKRPLTVADFPPLVCNRMVRWAMYRFTVPPRCATVWTPGIVTPPDSKMPEVRTRCYRKPHVTGEHAWSVLDAAKLDGR